MGVFALVPCKSKYALFDFGTTWLCQNLPHLASHFILMNKADHLICQSQFYMLIFFCLATRYLMWATKSVFQRRSPKRLLGVRVDQLALGNSHALSPRRPGVSNSPWVALSPLKH